MKFHKLLLLEVTKEDIRDNFRKYSINTLKLGHFKNETIKASFEAQIVLYRSPEGRIKVIKNNFKNDTYVRHLLDNK